MGDSSEGEIELNTDSSEYSDQESGSESASTKSESKSSSQSVKPESTNDSSSKQKSGTPVLAETSSSSPEDLLAPPKKQKTKDITVSAEDSKNNSTRTYSNTGEEETDQSSSLNSSASKSTSSNFTSLLNSSTDTKKKKKPHVTAARLSTSAAADVENPKYTSIQIFQHKIISASIIRGINLFRQTSKKESLQEDSYLNKIASFYSESLAEDALTADSSKIPQLVSKQPFVFFEMHYCDHPISDNAFTTVINNWTTDPKVSKSLLSNFNCAGVGVSIDEFQQAYFTLILGLRSFIGCDQFKKLSLFSIMMAEKCLRIVNDIRLNQFHLKTLFLEPDLCTTAFKFAEMESSKITKEMLSDSVGTCSNYLMAFGQVRAKMITPELIVQEWMNQLGKTESVLGDFNRVGFGFYKKKDNIHSVRILVRYLESAIVDGSESSVDADVLAQQTAEIMNQFRVQHGLAEVNIEDDLTQIAQSHATYIANGEIGENPLESEAFEIDVKTQFIALDITHLTCNEISRAPKAIMAKWRNNQKCVSVLLNQIDALGIGICFDEDFVCHATIIMGSRGIESPTVNKIVIL